MAVVLNPAAGRGRAERQWPSLHAKLRAALGPFAVYESTAPGEERALAARAYGDGARHVIAVGGDGTVNGVLNGLLSCTPERRGAPDWRLSTLPAGTGNDLSRALGVTDLDHAIARISARNEQWYDLLLASCTGANGARSTRAACAVVSWGAAAEISYRTSRSRILKRLGGRFSYYAVTLFVTLTYPNHEADISVDHHDMPKLTHYTGLVCNLERLGGGMKLAPQTDPQDGIADLVLFEDIARKDILLQPPSWLFEGKHIEHAKVAVFPGRTFRVDGPPAARVDADGESIGRLPLEIEVAPHALPLIG